MKTLVAAAEPPERGVPWVVINGGTTASTTTTSTVGVQVTTVTGTFVGSVTQPSEEA